MVTFSSDPQLDIQASLLSSNPPSHRIVVREGMWYQDIPAYINV